jgi:hypothetical protein
MLAVPIVHISSVWPSGSAFATMSAPRLPPAPARLSTTTGWPSSGARRSASSRAVRSVAPPPWKGTTSRTGRDGAQGACARAARAGRANAVPRMARRETVMDELPLS